MVSLNHESNELRYAMKRAEERRRAQELRRLGWMAAAMFLAGAAIMLFLICRS